MLHKNCPCERTRICRVQKQLRMFEKNIWLFSKQSKIYDPILGQQNLDSHIPSICLLFVNLIEMCSWKSSLQYGNKNNVPPMG